MDNLKQMFSNIVFYKFTIILESKLLGFLKVNEMGFDKKLNEMGFVLINLKL